MGTAYTEHGRSGVGVWSCVSVSVCVCAYVGGVCVTMSKWCRGDEFRVENSEARREVESVIELSEQLRVESVRFLSSTNRIDKHRLCIRYRF